MGKRKKVGFSRALIKKICIFVLEKYFISFDLIARFIFSAFFCFFFFWNLDSITIHINHNSVAIMTNKKALAIIITEARMLTLAAPAHSMISVVPLAVQTPSLRVTSLMGVPEQPLKLKYVRY